MPIRYQIERAATDALQRKLNPYQPSVEQDTKPIDGFEQREAVETEPLSEGNEGLYYSRFGTLVWSNLIMPRQGQASLRFDTVLFEVNRSKNIIQTQINNRSGTVKEYWNDGDYQITVRGKIVSDASNVYPHDAVRDLQELLNLQAALDVASEYLLLFDIYSMVVVDYSFPQEQGQQNSQSFVINALSDEPLELILDA